MKPKLDSIKVERSTASSNTRTILVVSYTKLIRIGPVVSDIKLFTVRFVRLWKLLGLEA